MKFICLTDANVHGYKFPITKGKIYEGHVWEDEKYGDKYVDLINDKGNKDGFNLNWFMSLDEYRQRKLEDLGI